MQIMLSSVKLAEWPSNGQRLVNITRQTISSECEQRTAVNLR